MTVPSAEELRKHPVFGTLDRDNLNRFITILQPKQVRRNEEVFAAGEPAEQVALILDGTVKIVAPAANQREVILELLGGGDLVGDEAVADDIRSYGATALRDADLLVFSAAAIRTLWGRSPDFAVAWMKVVSAGKRRLLERITELAYGNIEDRLFRMLSHLAQFHGVPTKKGHVALRFRLTHQELANLIGATRETTTLAVGRLKSSGAIGFVEGKIVLKDKLQSEALGEHPG